MKSKGRLIIITSYMLFPEEINVKGKYINYPLNVPDGTETSQPLVNEEKKYLIKKKKKVIASVCLTVLKPQ